MIGLYQTKPRFQRRLSGLAERLAAREVHLDVLTALGVGCAGAASAALALSSQTPLLMAAVPPLVGARIALNALDGMVATRRGLARPWGKVLNEVADRVADLACLAGLALVPGASPTLVAAVGAIVLLSSHLGVVAEAAGGRRQYGGVMGKADRMLWLAIAAAWAALTGDRTALTLLPWIWLVGATLTFAYRWEAIRGDLESAR